MPNKPERRGRVFLKIRMGSAPKNANWKENNPLYPGYEKNNTTVQGGLAKKDQIPHYTRENDRHSPIPYPLDQRRQQKQGKCYRQRGKEPCHASQGSNTDCFLTPALEAHRVGWNYRECGVSIRNSKECAGDDVEEGVSDSG